jgi:penicillin-binding protein 2
MNSFFERRYIIAGIFITLILVLLARLFYIQIIDDRYVLYAQGNVLRKVYLNPARGPILDRNHKILVQNQAFYDITVIPKDIKPFDTLTFCKLLGIDKAEFDRRLEKAIRYSPRLSSVFEKQLSAEAFAAISERLSEFPGFDSSPRYLRTYPDSVAAQFLGYIGEVTERGIKRSGGYYHPGDFVGVSGVERSYEDVLRGRRGVRNLMVDSRNRPKGEYANGAYDTTQVAGQRLISSLDLRIQKLGEKLMKNKVGSIVAIEPSTGEILCYVSSPTYNPNLLVGHDRGNNAAKLYKDPYKPFFVRPIQAIYPPGSSFKPLSALIAMQEGVITPQTTYYCPGYYWAGNHKVPCYHGEAHGTVNLSSAVAESCNGYFSMVFEKLINYYGAKQTESTFTNWRNNVAKFGLGSKLGLDMPAEGRGYLPTSSYYDKIYHKGGWRSSTVISLAIGQGELEATPMQLANIECTIANHGFYYKPHLIKAIGDREVERKEYTIKNYVGIDSQYFEPVIDGMQAVVDHGTAASSKIPGIVMCGKTGTAQVHGEDNSVFVAYAPRDNPKIAIAVVVENAGEGARWAAPIASFIVEKYLRDSITERPSGITPEFFMNANKLPPVDDDEDSKPEKKPQVKPSTKHKTDTVSKKATAKLNRRKNVKGITAMLSAAEMERREDE